MKEDADLASATSSLSMISQTSSADRRWNE